MLTRRQVQTGAPALLISTAVSQKAARGEARLEAVICDSATKYRSRRNDVNPNPTLELHAARNEFETIQLALSANGIALDALSVSDVEFREENGRATIDDVALFLVDAIPVRVPSDSRGEAGPWPDRLIPLRAPFRVEADIPTVIWLRVRVPASALAGRYRATLRFTSGSRQLLTIPATLTVFAARLPEEPTLPFLAGVDWEGAVSHMGREGPERLRAVLGEEGIFPLNLEPRLVSPPHDPGRLLDGARLDAMLSEAEAFGPGPFPLPFNLAGPIDPARFPPFSPAWREAATAYLKSVAVRLERRGTLDRAFIYFAELDEPIHEERIRLIAAFHELVAATDKRLRVAQTIHAECLDCDGGTLQQLDSDVTLWVPNISFLNGQAVGLERRWGMPRITRLDSGFPGGFEAAVRKSGRPVWSYLNPATADLQAPQPGYPSLFIDHDAMAHRIIGWMAWGRGISAVGHWMANDWNSSNPWQVPLRGTGNVKSNGDGMLVYPPPGSQGMTGQPAGDGPLLSIRSECIRETCEDHKLLCVAEKKLGRPATEQIVSPLYRSLNSFDDNPAAMRYARLQLLRELSA